MFVQQPLASTHGFACPATGLSGFCSSLLRFRCALFSGLLFPDCVTCIFALGSQHNLGPVNLDQLAEVLKAPKQQKSIGTHFFAAHCFIMATHLITWFCDWCLVLFPCSMFQLIFWLHCSILVGMTLINTNESLKCSH